LGDAEAKVQGKVGVAAERLAPAIRVREVEDEVEATGMHIGMVASVFFCMFGTSLGDVEPMGGCMGACMSVWGQRFELQSRRWWWYSPVPHPFS
jgi:hypothetical protein